MDPNAKFVLCFMFHILEYTTQKTINSFYWLKIEIPWTVWSEAQRWDAKALYKWSVTVSVSRIPLIPQCISASYYCSIHGIANLSCEISILAVTPRTVHCRYYTHISRISCQKGPTRHAYAWQIGPFWQDTLDILARVHSYSAYVTQWGSRCVPTFSL